MAHYRQAVTPNNIRLVGLSSIYNVPLAAPVFVLSVPHGALTILVRILVAFLVLQLSVS
jgi:hypothetical protein